MIKPELALQVGITTFYTVVFAFFVIAPFRSKLRFSPKRTLGIAGIYTVLSLVLFLKGFDGTNMIPDFFPVALILWLVLTIGGCFLCVKTNPKELLFSVFIILHVQANVLVVSTAVKTVCFTPWFESAMADGSGYLWGGLIFVSIFLLIFVPMMWYLFMVLLKKVVDFHIDFRNWRFLWLIPMLFYVSGRVSNFGGVARDGIYTSRDLLVLVLSNALAFATLIVCLKMLIKTHESLLAAERARAMEQQLRLQKNEYTKLVERITETDHQRHDLHHHFVALYGFFQDGEYEKAGEYLAQFAEENRADGAAPFCGNLTADHLLRHFTAMARSAGAEVLSLMHLPENAGVADTDLCVVLGNLLENAVTALQNQSTGKKYLTVRGEMIGHQLAISVENSYNGAVDYRDGVYYSTKHEGEGIGLSSVRGIIDRGGGSFQISTQEGVFTADVLLNF
ncbi:MAG: GHKL domain-containing protein [Oscillospiraceae bacterium]